MIKLFCYNPLAAENPPEPRSPTTLWKEAEPIITAPIWRKTKTLREVTNSWTLDELLATCRHVVITCAEKYKGKRKGRQRTMTRANWLAGNLFATCFLKKANPKWKGEPGRSPNPPCVVGDEPFGRLLKIIESQDEPWAWRYFLLSQLLGTNDWDISDAQTNRLADAADGIIANAAREDPWVLSLAFQQAMNAMRIAYLRTALSDERISARFPAKRGSAEWIKNMHGAFMTKLPDEDIPPGTLRKIKRWRDRAKKLIVAYAASDRAVSKRFREVKECFYYRPPLETIDALVRHYAVFRLVPEKLDYPGKKGDTDVEDTPERE